MAGYLFLLFTIVPAVELYILIKVGSYIGALNTITILIFTGILGAYLAKMQGLLVMQKMQNSLNKGQMPTNELIDAFMIFAGGILLLTPGFLTDVFGILLLFPLTRGLIKLLVKAKLKDMIKKGQIISFSSVNSTSSRNNGYNDIDI